MLRVQISSPAPKQRKLILLIKIINVDVEQQTAKNGRAFEKAEVLFESEGKKNTKNIFSFANPSVFKAVKDSERGKTYQVDQIKDDKGYWQWTSFSPFTSGTTSTQDKPVVSPTSGNRNFETKEERDARQRLIVRQSSLTAALSTLGAGAMGPLDPEAVKALASDYTDWVFEKVDIFDQPNDLE